MFPVVIFNFLQNVHEKLGKASRLEGAPYPSVVYLNQPVMFINNKWRQRDMTAIVKDYLKLR